MDEQIRVFTYPVSYDELIETWVKENEKFGHCLIIYEARAHREYLKSLKLPFNDEDMYFTEVFCVEFDDFDQARALLNFFDFRTGPHVQLWSSGNLLTDNIESAKQIFPPI